jgi:excisionase family DNA binding protein
MSQEEQRFDWNMELVRTRNMATEKKRSAVLASPASLLTVAEVARLFQVPTSWVYERTRQRGLYRLPGFRLGKYWRFREADVLAWLERQRSGGHSGA